MKKSAAWADLDREEGAGMSTTRTQGTPRVETEASERSI